MDGVLLAAGSFTGPLVGLAVEPDHSLVLGNRQQRPAQRILADHLVHPQQPRIDLFVS